DKDKKQGEKGKQPRQMSKEEAKTLLNGLENDSLPRALAEEKKGGYPKVTKDW
ncbi:MAG: hypothetical protein HQK92_15500, partial [Nitrospirae bacterium]|nr:hypothetical protein [Nitrospirota bacterium]